MDDPYRWCYARIGAWAVIGGERYPIESAQIEYALNEVPRAIVGLPLGRRLDTGGASPAHTLPARMTEPLEAAIYLRADPGTASDEAVLLALGIPPGRDVRIFHGETAGLGASRSRGPDGGGYRLTVAMNHWLARMAESSALSKSSHPANPAFLTYGAVLEMGQAGAGAAAATTLEGLASEVLDPSGVEEDLWARTIKPWLEQICRFDTFIQHDANLNGPGTNDAALAVLARFNENAPRYAPLALDTGLDQLGDIAASIIQDIKLGVADPSWMAHATLWDVLVGRLAPDYAFAIVPRVEDALAVPYVAAYAGPNGTPYRAILGETIAEWQLSATSPRPLRAVGFLARTVDQSGANMNDSDAAGVDEHGIGGLFDTGQPGQILYAQLPNWAGRMVVPSTHAPDASGGASRPVASALHPDAGEDNGAKARGRAAARITSSLMRRLAQARYAEEATRSRFGVVGGALRLDLAPGSTVVVEGPRERILGNADASATPFCGTVVRHALSLSVEQATLGSVLHLAHGRYLPENGLPTRSVSRHPMYTATFAGAPLVEL